MQEGVYDKQSLPKIFQTIAWERSHEGIGISLESRVIVIALEVLLRADTIPRLQRNYFLHSTIPRSVLFEYGKEKQEEMEYEMIYWKVMIRDFVFGILDVFSHRRRSLLIDGAFRLLNAFNAFLSSRLLVIAALYCAAIRRFTLWANEGIKVTRWHFSQHLIICARIVSFYFLVAIQKLRHKACRKHEHRSAYPRLFAFSGFGSCTTERDLISKSFPGVVKVRENNSKISFSFSHSFDVKQGTWTVEELKILIQFYIEFVNFWKKFACDFIVHRSTINWSLMYIVRLCFSEKKFWIRRQQIDTSGKSET